jgi:hypothetical protein
MSLYQTQKFLYNLNRDQRIQSEYRENLQALLNDYDLTAQERQAFVDGDVGLLYVLGVNGQILMHYAAFLGVAWFDYLDLMRKGVEQYGPVRAGVYAMTGDGESFAVEEARK